MSDGTNRNYSSRGEAASAGAARKAARMIAMV